MTGTQREIWAALALMIAVVTVYLPAFDAGHIIDDDNYVFGNETLRSGKGLLRIWTDLEASPQYYPLTFTSFWLEYHAWGNRSAGYHVTNVFLHLIAALLVWRALAQLSMSWAWLAAAIFAVHPVHVESVAWIAERKNVLSACFFLASVLAFQMFSGLSSRAISPRHRRLVYGASLLLFCLAMLSKTASVSLPIVLLLISWWKRGRVRGKDVLSLTPFLAIGTVLGAVTVWIESTRGGASGDLWDLSLVDRVLVAGRAVWFYAAKLLWPVDLSFNYPRWTVDSSVGWQYAYPVGLVVFVGILWILRQRIGRGPLVAVLYFVVSLGPTLGFFNVYFFRYAYVADHFQYLASIGIVSLVVGGAASLRAESSERVKTLGRIVAMVVLVLLGALTYERAKVFRNLEALCLDTLAKNPQSWLARNNLGNLLLRRGELPEALTHLEGARDLDPTAVETHLDLAIAYMNLQRFADAVDAAREATRIAPGNSLGYRLLGDALLRAGRAGEAIPWFEEAMTLDSDDVKTQVGLATAWASTGRCEQAVKLLEPVVTAHPDDVPARANLASCLARLNRYGEAVVQLEKALELDPGNSILLRNLRLALQGQAEIRSDR